MSPTWITVPTSGSALTESMNAGVALNSAVSPWNVPYGASPYTARVNAPRVPLLSAAAAVAGGAHRASAAAAAIQDRLITSSPQALTRGSHSLASALR